jgi:hypothetical protein
VDQPRVSRIERGDLARTEVGSLAAYAEAMGGTLELVVHIGGRAYPLPVGANPGTETSIKESSPAEPSPGNKAAQKPMKKAEKSKTARASGSTGRKRLAG